MSAAEDLDKQPAPASEELDLMTVAEAATFLKMSAKTLYVLIEGENIPYIRIGERRLRLRRSSLVAWLASQERAPRR